jgi:CHRD domain
MRMRGFLAALAVAAGLPMLGVSAASAQGIELFAVLEGEEEIPAPADHDGRGVASILFRNPPAFNVICYLIRVDNIETPTLAHIHSGSVADSGGIVVDLAPAPTSGVAGTSGGCKGITPTLSAQIRNEPWKFYVNVHNDSFPNGAIRGQLFRDTSN